MMIDDDVPIPHNLQVPVNILSRNPEIKAICYVIEAKTEDGSANALVELQDAEYKLAGLVKQFQWQYGTTLCCHGAISLWRRDVLGRKILWDHDTEFHGEDLYMGILLHRMRKNYAIMVLSDAIVPTYAPEDMLTLFRQRVTSWDLCAQRKFMTQVKSFVFGWCNTRTLILKPFILQEVFNVMLDWIRIYLMTALLVRNPVGLLLCFILFYGILYIEMGAFHARLVLPPSLPSGELALESFSRAPSYSLLLCALPTPPRLSAHANASLPPSSLSLSLALSVPSRAQGSSTTSSSDRAHSSRSRCGRSFSFRSIERSLSLSASTPSSGT